MNMPKSTKDCRFRTFHIIGNNGEIVSHAICAYTEPKNKKMSVGVSICSPYDRYNKRIGRLIAMGRMKHEKDSFTDVFIGDSVKDSLRFLVITEALNKKIRWMYDILNLDNASNSGVRKNLRERIV